MTKKQIPIREVVGSPFQASKWQTCPMLIDVDEMINLLNHIGNIWIVQVSGLIEKGKEIIEQKEFVEVYSTYIQNLKEGKVLSNRSLQSCFSSVWTTSLEALYAVPVPQRNCSLIKVAQPVVQLQNLKLSYSKLDEKFHSMVFGPESIEWGIQFSYPHLFQNESHEIFTVRNANFLPNNALFKAIQEWMRLHTIPTPFVVQEKKTNTSFRLGKRCLTWINEHPQLKLREIQVFF